jgi:hypothetical protein
VSFTSITICIAFQRVFIIVVYFIIDSVRKLLDTPSYNIFFLCSFNTAVSFPKASTLADLVEYK